MEPKRIVKARCHKCGKRYEAASFDELSLLMDKDEKGYVCKSCKTGKPARERV